MNVSLESYKKVPELRNSFRVKNGGSHNVMRRAAMGRARVVWHVDFELAVRGRTEDMIRGSQVCSIFSPKKAMLCL